MTGSTWIAVAACGCVRGALVADRDGRASGTGQATLGGWVIVRAMRWKCAGTCPYQPETQSPLFVEEAVSW